MHRKKEVVQKENKVKVNLTRKIEKPSLDMHFVHHQSPQRLSAVSLCNLSIIKVLKRLSAVSLTLEELPIQLT